MNFFAREINFDQFYSLGSQEKLYFIQRTKKIAADNINRICRKQNFNSDENEE